MKQRMRPYNGEELFGSAMNDNQRSDDDSNEIQLHKMKAHEHFIEAQVQEGDTLQAIALRFYCSISELKRINHIHKDNEIFARRTIRVPVTPYSVLTELIPQPTVEPVPSTSTHSPLSLNGSTQKQVNLSKSADNKDNDYAIDCNAVVLNSTLIPSVISYTDDPSDSVAEDTQLLPNKGKEPVETVVVKELTSHGADFGLKWFHLVICIIILGVITPLVYIMFYLDKHEHSDIPPLQKT